MAFFVETRKNLSDRGRDYRAAASFDHSGADSNMMLKTIYDQILRYAVIIVTVN